MVQVASTPTLYIYRCSECGQHKLTTPIGSLGYTILPEAHINKMTGLLVKTLCVIDSDNVSHEVPYGFSRFQGRAVEPLTAQEGAFRVEHKHQCVKISQMAASRFTPSEDNAPSSLISAASISKPLKPAVNRDNINPDGTSLDYQTKAHANFRRDLQQQALAPINVVTDGPVQISTSSMSNAAGKTTEQTVSFGNAITESESKQKPAEAYGIVKASTENPLPYMKSNPSVVVGQADGSGVISTKTTIGANGTIDRRTVYSGLGGKVDRVDGGLFNFKY